MEQGSSSEVGAISQLFQSCVDLFWAILQRLRVSKVDKREEDALRTEFGRFYFWGDGYYPHEGRLDALLMNSSRLKQRVLSILVEVGELVCNDNFGIFRFVSEDFRDAQLYSQRSDVRSLVEAVQESLDDVFSSDSDSSSESSEVGTLEEVIDGLRSRNQCLLDLSSALDRPAADCDFGEVEAIATTPFKVSGPAEVWTRKIVDTYPNIDITLAERLGEANWRRYQRITKGLADIEALASDSGDQGDEGDDDGAVEEVVAIALHSTASTRLSQGQDSDFSGRGPRSSDHPTTMTSISNAGFDHTFTNVRKRRRDMDTMSRATFTSVMTNDQGQRGWLRIPAFPDAAASGTPFACSICGRKQKDISNRIDWKKHVFADLEPYICTFQECKGGIASFNTRKLWADHEFSNHRMTSIWKCNDCGIEFHEIDPFRLHTRMEHRNVVIGNQLETLLKSAEISTRSCEEDLPCPFCFEALGNKIRLFAMHVARHLEEISLAVLPRYLNSENDEESSTSSQSLSMSVDAGDVGSQAPSDNDSIRAVADFPSQTPRPARRQLSRRTPYPDVSKAQEQIASATRPRYNHTNLVTVHLPQSPRPRG